MCSMCLPAACLDQLPRADTCTHLLQVMSHTHMSGNCIIHALRFTPEQAPQPLGMDKDKCGCCQTHGQIARQSVKLKAHFNDLSEAHGWTSRGSDLQVTRPSRGAVSLCVTLWTTVHLELDSSLGLPSKCGCRHLISCQALCCCESVQTKAN